MTDVIAIAEISLASGSTGRRGGYRATFKVAIRSGACCATFLYPRLSVRGCAYCGTHPRLWHVTEQPHLVHCPKCDGGHRDAMIGSEQGEGRWNDGRLEPTHLEWFELTPEQVKGYGEDERRQEIECGMCHEMIQLLVLSKERPTSCRCDACQRELEKSWREEMAAVN